MSMMGLIERRRWWCCDRLEIEVKNKTTHKEWAKSRGAKEINVLDYEKHAEWLKNCKNNISLSYLDPERLRSQFVAWPLKTHRLFACKAFDAFFQFKVMKFLEQIDDYFGSRRKSRLAKQLTRLRKHGNLWWWLNRPMIFFYFWLSNDIWWRWWLKDKNSLSWRRVFRSMKKPRRWLFK